MESPDVLSKAFEEGTKKLKDVGDAPYMAGATNQQPSGGSPIGTGGEYAPSGEAHMRSMTSRTNMSYGLKPGQFYGHYGTTTYNPLRSSKEVEAVLGEAKYAPKVEENSPEAVNKKQVELEQRISDLQNQVATLVGVLQTKVNVTENSTAPVSTAQNQNRTVSELRNEAKSKGLPYVGKNKAQLIEILNNADK